MWSTVSPPTPTLIREEFGIDAGELRPHNSGFEGDGFTDGRWFVKLWRQQPDDDAALALTAQLAARGIPVPAAQQTMRGTFTAVHQLRSFAVFPFVEGHTATWDQSTGIAKSMRDLHEITDIELPRTSFDERQIDILRHPELHPWLQNYRDEISSSIDRLDRVIAQARNIPVPHVICHHDMFPHNVLVDREGNVVSILDWGHPMFAPREHDLFAALCGSDTVRFLHAYGAQDLNVTHLEYARLARSLRDIAARVMHEVDRDGIDTWGIEGLRRVDADLALARPFCER